MTGKVKPRKGATRYVTGGKYLPLHAWETMRRKISLFNYAILFVAVALSACGGGDSSFNATDQANVGDSPTEAIRSVWSMTSGTLSDDKIVAIGNDNSGNLYVLGQTQGTISGGSQNPDPSGYTSDIFVSKYGATGTLIWNTQFGSARSEYAVGISVDPAGNQLFVVGTTMGSFFGTNISGVPNMFAISLDSAGNVLWGRQYAPTSPYIGTEAVGIAYTTATRHLYIAGNPDGLLKLNPDTGAIIGGTSHAGFTSRLSNTQAYSGHNYSAVAVDESGTAVVVGSLWACIDNTRTQDNVPVVKNHPYFISIDANGSVINYAWRIEDGWTQAYVDNRQEAKVLRSRIPTSVAIGKDRNIYIGAYHTDALTNTLDIKPAVFKLQMSMSPTETNWWQEFSSAPVGSAIFSVNSDGYGNVYFAGTSPAQIGDKPFGGIDYFFGQIDSFTSRILWIRQFGTSANDYAQAVSIDRNGNVYVGGRSDGYYDYRGFDYFLAKYSSRGTQ